MIAFVDSNDPNGPAEAPPISLSHFRGITDGDRALEEQFLQLYLHTAHRCIDQMNAVLSQDHNNIWRAATHELKGASKNIGADRMADICRQCEQTASYSERKHHLERIVEECARIEIFVEDLYPAKG